MATAICIFITFSCFRRLPLLGSPASRTTFVETLDTVRHYHRFQLLGYVVMPEHIHLLISEPSLGTPSKTLQILKQKVSAKLAASHKNRSFWQRRFYDFNVWSTEKVTEKLDYIHNNPIKRQLVSHPNDWPWSSWSNYIRGEGLIAIDSIDQGWEEGNVKIRTL